MSRVARFIAGIALTLVGMIVVFVCFAACYYASFWWCGPESALGPITFFSDSSRWLGLVTFGIGLVLVISSLDKSREVRPWTRV